MNASRTRASEMTPVDLSNEPGPCGAAVAATCGNLARCRNSSLKFSQVPAFVKNGPKGPPQERSRQGARFLTKTRNREEFH